MKLDELADMIPANGQQKVSQLRRNQPPAGGLSERMLEDRAQAAADWLRGYMHCLADQGKITEAQFAVLWHEISVTLLPEHCEECGTRTKPIERRLCPICAGDDEL